MKKNIICIIFSVVSIILFNSFEASARRATAVFIEGDVSNGQEQVINSAFVSRLVKNKQYSLFERNEAFIEALNKEHDFELSGEVPESQIRKVGNKFGVDYVIVVVVTMDEDRTYMSARLINLVTGQIIKHVNLDRRGWDTKTLQNLANSVVYRLLNN